MMCAAISCNRIYDADSRAIAGGPEAHVHHFRRDPENLDYVFMQHSELDLPQGDTYSMGSFDDRCVLGECGCGLFLRSSVGVAVIPTMLHSPL